MPPAQHVNTHPTHSNNDNHPNTHDSGLISKLYSQILTNNTVQNGIKEVMKFSQPLIEKLDDNLLRLMGNVRKWAKSKNVYNQLANIWLSNNFPSQETVMPYETFTKEFRYASYGKFKETSTTFQQPGEIICKNFYNHACQKWNQLNDPSVDEIKNALLFIVAKTLTQSLGFEDDSNLSEALYNMLRMLIEKRRELVSGETYYNIVRASLGDDFYLNNQQATKVACYQYYTFAKRFLLVDFPLLTCNKDVLKLILHFIQDNSFYYGDFTLNFIEKRLDKLLKFVGEKTGDQIDDKKLTEKAQRILRKVRALTHFPVKKAAENALHQVQETKAYTTLDRHFHINNKIDSTIYLTALGYNMLKENLLEPSLTTFKVITDKAKSQVIVIIDGLDVQLLKNKKRYHQLYAKYQVLQKCVVIVADETVKLIFDKDALAGLESSGKKELMRLYQEVKTMETKKIMDISADYYRKILKKANQTYKLASKVVYYKMKEIGDQETAAYVRPANDAEVDNYDKDLHPHITESQRAIEEVAMRNLE